MWGYIHNVADADVDPQPDAHLDALLRRALDLPRENWDLVHLARQLDLGIWEAKRLETSLRIFQGGAYRVTTKPAPEVARAVPRPTPPKKAEEARDVKRCSPHKAKAVSRHPCGTWLCSACLDEEECPSCRKPLHVAKSTRDEDDAGGEEPEAPLPPPPPKERPPRRRDEDANRDFNRL
jgi:ribosomal protein L37AE/L43A